MYLNCKTYFSFRYGTFSAAALVAAAVERGVSAMALTNINSTCDIWDFVKLCRQAGIKPIAGAEIRNPQNGLLYVLLAANNQGFEWLNAFLSGHLQEGSPFPEYSGEVPFFHLPQDGFVIYPLGARLPEQLHANEKIGVRPWEVNKLFGTDLRQYGSSFVILQPVTFQDKTYYNVHRLLRAIDDNVLLSKLDPDRVCHTGENFAEASKLLEAFQQYPMIVTNTYRLMEACSIEMVFGTDKNKKQFSATGEDDRILLEKLALEGLKWRYKKSKTAEARVRKELKIINDLGFNAYFLITWDLLRYAESRGFYHVGRGSGANSIVAYCLKITDVDPIELDLYFERFLNPYRTSPPDFDLDFSWLDRDEVIDYVFKRYGRKHVALLGMYTTFKFRAAIRELGKVFGLPKAEIDALSVARVAEDKMHQLIFKYGQLLEGFPNHLSIHPGGMLISEEPLTQYATLGMPPKGFPTAQLDMFVAESIGLYKLDVLSQRGLGHIKEALRLVRENLGVDVNIHEIDKFKQDKLVRQQISSVKTIGCFYIESPAMRQLLLKLRCSDYLTLVAASSIIRPGVSQSGMMKQYIYRYHHPGEFDYLHPKMKELLQETYGVMVYQEDVIKVAHHFAGLDMGEADVLRRAMSGKYRGNKEMMRIKEKFFSNCEEMGHDPATVAEVWRQIESFGGYSFSKAHSASFAVESYQSLFLKTYYPREFMVAVINNFGGFYSRELYFYELHKTGAVIHLPCVNHSTRYTCITGNDVYVGFIHLRGLEEKLTADIEDNRLQHGPYLSLQNFIERVGPGPEYLNMLIRIGAFRFTGKQKKQLLWEANFLQKRQVAHPSSGALLFEEAPVEFQLPVLSFNALDDAFDELELLGFPLHNPFKLVDDDPECYTNADGLRDRLGQMVTILVYLITYKPVRTIKGDLMCFGTFMDYELNWVDTVHFPDVLRAFPLHSGGFYLLTGKVVEEFGVYSVEVVALHSRGLKKRKIASLLS